MANSKDCRIKLFYFLLKQKLTNQLITKTIILQHQERYIIMKE